MNIKHISLACMLSLGVLSLQGCATDVAADGSDGEEATAESGLSSAAARLVGSYVLEGGRSNQSIPLIQGLRLNRDGSFLSDLDTGIRCFRAPCPSHVRVKGTFTATATKLTLTSNDRREVQSYAYKAVNTEFGVSSLELTQASFNRIWTNTLVNANGAYCRDANDCATLPLPAVQGAIHTCEENRCGSGNTSTRPKVSKCLAAICAPGTECIEVPGTRLGFDCVSPAIDTKFETCLTKVCPADTKCIELFTFGGAGSHATCASTLAH
jgi:hypothetical protein